MIFVHGVTSWPGLTEHLVVSASPNAFQGENPPASSNQRSSGKRQRRVMGREFVPCDVMRGVVGAGLSKGVSG